MPPIATGRPPIVSLTAAFLRKRVGRHDGPAPPAGRSRQTAPACAAGSALDDLFEAQVDADDAGRRDQHLLGRAAERGCRGRGHATRHVHARISGAGVGTAAVDDDGARRAAGPREVLARDEDRRRLGEVRREHRGRRGGRVGHDERQIQTAAGLDAGADARGAEAQRRSSRRPRSLRATASVMRRGWARWRLGRRPTPGAYTGSCTRSRPSSSGTSIPYWPHFLNCGHLTQSVKTFSSSHSCGTIEKPRCAKYAGACVNAQSLSYPSRLARRRSSSTSRVPIRRPRADRSTASDRTSATCGLSGASSAHPTIRRGPSGRRRSALRGPSARRSRAEGAGPPRDWRR